MTIQHNYPGATYTIPELHPLDEKKRGEQIREIIKARFDPELDARGIPHVLHLFLDTDNAPASAIAATLFKVAESCSAAVIVMACHNKAYGWNAFLLGSVADYCTKHARWPTMIIRDYKAPLVIPASSSPPTSNHTTPR